MPAPWEPGYQPETRTLKQIKRDYHRSVRPPPLTQAIRGLVRGLRILARGLAIILGIIIFCAVCGGLVHALGLVPFLLLCLLFQGTERRT